MNLRCLTNKTKIRFIKPKVLKRQPIVVSELFDLDKLNQPVEFSNEIEFDELRSFVPLDRDEREMHSYKELKSKGMSLYEVSTLDKKIREGARIETETFL